jgi:hypothetical protein
VDPRAGLENMVKTVALTVTRTPTPWSSSPLPVAIPTAIPILRSPGIKYLVFVLKCFQSLQSCRGEGKKASGRTDYIEFQFSPW